MIWVIADVIQAGVMDLWMGGKHSKPVPGAREPTLKFSQLEIIPRISIVIGHCGWMTISTTTHPLMPLPASISTSSSSVVALIDNPR